MSDGIHDDLTRSAPNKRGFRQPPTVIEERTVSNDNTVAWNGKRLQLPESRLRPHFVKAQVRVHEYPDGTCAVFLGPHRLADYDAEGALRVPTAAKPGVVLGAVKDKPCRARLRASLTAPPRDASSAAQAGTRKRPPSRTRKHPTRTPRLASMTHSKQAVRGFSWVDEGKPASRPGVPVPIPTRCREAGNGNWERSADQRFVRR